MAVLQVILRPPNRFRQYFNLFGAFDIDLSPLNVMLLRESDSALLKSDSALLKVIWHSPQSFDDFESGLALFKVIQSP